MLKRAEVCESDLSEQVQRESLCWRVKRVRLEEAARQIPYSIQLIILPLDSLHMNGSTFRQGQSMALFSWKAL